MSIKDLFKKDYIPKTIAAVSVGDIGDEVESADYIESYKIDRDRFTPPVDFTVPSNFARFGSAEKYYEDSITRIYSTYPFDGSLREKLAWHNTGSHLDTFIFEREYPRTNGHIRLSPDGQGTMIASSSEGFRGVASASMEYIRVKGGPNVGPGGTYVDANILDISEGRESNLRFGGDVGNTVEFWLKKSEPVDYPTGSLKEVIFDLWNGESVSHVAGSQYGRFLIHIDGTTQAPTSSLRVTYVSGTVSACTDQIIGTEGTAHTGALFNEEWNHYAISTINSGSDLKIWFYLNGDLNDIVTVTGGAINEVTGALIANIGALRTKVIPSESPPADNGWGKLSGSLDEFRFWKRRRTSKKIGRYWFDQVGGGTNSDPSNTDLGIYFKFNEGIVGDSDTDLSVLDYSGRLSHGTWIGYTSSASPHRVTSSAMVEAGAAESEFKDPIIYSEHSDVQTLLTEKSEIGFAHDSTNNAGIYHTLPEWITSEDEEKEKRNALNLTQIMASVFDDLYMKIEMLPRLQDAEYVSSSFKPIPFAGRLLESHGFVAPEIFSDAEIISQFANRDEDRIFNQKLHNIKNLIYQNVYNNLTYIYKSKGTEKAFRNLIRCFGVDDEIYKINLYGDNVTFDLKPNFRLTSGRKKYVDFNNVDRFIGTVYQYADSSNPNSVSYISGSQIDGNDFENYLGFTMEAEVILPKKFEEDSSLYFSTPFISSSLFGIHTATPTASSTTWNDPDYANFQVYAVRDQEDSKDVYFVLTGSEFGINLTSSLFRDQYENERWNFAVRLKSLKYPQADHVTGTSDGYEIIGYTPFGDLFLPVYGFVSTSYTLEFYGVNMVLDQIQNEFLETATIPFTTGSYFMIYPKRCYIGCHRQNFTGSVLEKSDAKVSSVRVWMTYLDNETIQAHARDITNFGTEHPYRSAYLMQSDIMNTFVPQAETLALHWDFATVTGSSDSSGPLVSDAKFNVPDISSGSLEMQQNRYKWLGNIVKAQHTGRGDFFLGNDDQVIDKEYIASGKQKLPESIDSYDMIEILRKDDEFFTRETRPVNHFFAVEKSMYQTISEEMINLFATIVDFNNLIGEPVNRYRMEYKDLGKLRQLFFERIGNTPDIEKYVEFYKWIDSALSKMIERLIPASANFSEKIRTMIESHVLERNKYWTKYPTLEMKIPDPEAGAVSINRHLYSWASGSAPIDLDEDKNELWWKERAERNRPPLSIQTDVDESRTKILSGTLSALNRSFTTVYRHEVKKMDFVSDAMRHPRIENVETIYTSSYISSSVPNYKKIYQVVQTSGRRINNRAMVVSGGVGFSEVGVGSLENISPYYEGIYDFAKINRGRHAHVFVERFSAPGGPETSGDSDGGIGLDRISGELSVYNSLNYRNILLRVPLQLLLQEHCGQFGIDADYTASSEDYNVQPAYHKINRNPRCVKRIIFNSSSYVESVIDDYKYDNWYVQFQIPQSDLQYSWITASVEMTASGLTGRIGNKGPCGYSTGSGDITFVSQSICGAWLSSSLFVYGFDKNSFYPRSSPVDWIPVDFVGLNTVIFDPVSGSDNLLGNEDLRWWNWTDPDPLAPLYVGFCNYVATLANRTNLYIDRYRGGLASQKDGTKRYLGVIGIASILNGILLNRNGPYMWPSWKQIRTGETAVARYHKNNNIISIVEPPQDKVAIKQINASERARYFMKAIRSGRMRNYVEPPVTTRYKPFVHEFIVSSDRNRPMLMRYTHGNNLAAFANPELNNKLGTIYCDKQTYDKMVKKYTEEAEEEVNPVKQFSTLIYKETVYPKEENVYLGRTRDRQNWQQNSWRDSRLARTPLAGSRNYITPNYEYTFKYDRRKTRNSQNFLVTQSMWLLDSDLNYDSNVITSSASLYARHNGGDYLGEGELMNNYTTFFSSSASLTWEPFPTNTGSFYNRPDPSMPGNTNPWVPFFNKGRGATDGISEFNAAIPINWHGFPGSGTVGSNTAPLREYWDRYIGFSSSVGQPCTITAWINFTSSLEEVTAGGTNQPDCQTIIEFGDHMRWFGLKTGSAANTRLLTYRCGWEGTAGGVAEWIMTEELQDNTWYFVAVQYYPGSAGTTTANTASFWVNGTKRASTTNIAPIGTVSQITGGYASTLQALPRTAPGVTLEEQSGSLIGSSSFRQYPYEGMMSDVAVFQSIFDTSPLTPTKMIRTMYNGGIPISLYHVLNTLPGAKSYAKPLSWWRLGGGYGYFCVPDSHGDWTYNKRYIVRSNRVTGDPILYGLNYPGVMFNDHIKNFDPDQEYVTVGFVVADMIGNVHSVDRDDAGVRDYKYKWKTSDIVYNHQLSAAGEARDPRFLVDYKCGAIYARRELEYLDTPSSSWGGFEITGAGPCSDHFIRVTGSRIIEPAVKWTAASEAGKTPYFESFDKYNHDIRVVGKDYSIVPEFRISQHMYKFIEEEGGNFLAELPEFLELTGATISDSSNSNFFKTYSHSDFMKFFEIIKEDHKDIAKPSEIKLKCNAMIRFVPYEGFYPAQRCLQLTSLFSSSYSNFIKPNGYTSSFNYGAHENAASWRVFTTPMYNPGILFNSIKAGMAVDFPIYGKDPPIVREDFKAGAGGPEINAFIKYHGELALTTSVNRGLINTSSTGIYSMPISGNYSVNLSFMDQDGFYNANIQPYNFNVETYHNDLWGVNPLERDKQVRWKSVLASTFSDRVPFEALIEPENYLAKKTIWDMEPDHSASFNRILHNSDESLGVIWGGHGSPLYKLAMHNFLAEVPSFFLKDGKFTTFASKPIPPEGIIINTSDAKKYYGMDVVIYNSRVKNYTDFSQRIRTPEFRKYLGIDNLTIDESTMKQLKGTHTIMYNKDSAFGPPWLCPVENIIDAGAHGFYKLNIFSATDNAFTYHYGYEPFTPAYFNGFGLARIIFYPYKGAGNYTIDDIMTHLTTSYIRMPTDRLGFGGAFLTEKLLEWTTLPTMNPDILKNDYDIMNPYVFSSNNQVEGVRLFPVHMIAGHYLTASSNWMQLSASVNLFSKTKVKKVTYERGELVDYEPVTVEDDEANANTIWTIQPKWETPIMNFIGKNPPDPITKSVDHISTKGMWHQYGDQCTSSDGIWFQISDLPSTKIFSDVNRSTEQLPGRVMIGQSENELIIGSKNAEAILYIRDCTLIGSNVIIIDKTWGTCSVIGGDIDVDIGETVKGNRYITEKIAEYFGFNYQKDNLSPIDWTYLATAEGHPAYGLWEPNARFVPVEVYFPEEHPWKAIEDQLPTAINGKSTLGSEKVVAIRFKIVNVNIYSVFADPYNVGVNKSVYSVQMYPNYYALGSLGNSKKVAVLDDTPDNSTNYWEYLEGGSTTLFPTSSAIMWGGGDSPSDNANFIYGPDVYFYGGKTPKYKVASLADLLGFSKSQKRLGETHQEKVVREAVVAVPYVESQGSKRFFRIKRSHIDLAIGKRSARQGEDLPSKSIQDMVEAMQRYIFPPRMDFITYRDIKPFAMYIFEFEYKLSAKDLRDIWQNLPPDITTKDYASQQATIEHGLLENELLGDNIPNNLRWMVFKVKQKAEKNYFAKTSDSSDDERFKFAFKIGSSDSAQEAIPDYSYNWPYDFFSLVELVKIDAEVQFDANPVVETLQIAPIPGITEPTSLPSSMVRPTLDKPFAVAESKSDPILPIKHPTAIATIPQTVRPQTIQNIQKIASSVKSPFGGGNSGTR